MTDIPNTEYITINADGIFVGGNPATHYRGEKLYQSELVKDYFLYTQEKFPMIQELHVLSSQTGGNVNDIKDNPSYQHGCHAWCRVKFNDGVVGHWVLDYNWKSERECAMAAYSYCVAGISMDADFRAKLLSLDIQPAQKPEFSADKKCEQTAKPEIKESQPQQNFLHRMRNAWHTMFKCHKR